MQTTLRIGDEIYRQAKSKSGELGQSLTRFFEEAVEEKLQRLDSQSPTRKELPVSSTRIKSLSEQDYLRYLETAELESDLRGIS